MKGKSFWSQEPFDVVSLSTSPVDAAASFLLLHMKDNQQPDKKLEDMKNENGKCTQEWSDKIAALRMATW